MKLLTIIDVAAQLGVSRALVYREVKARRLPIVKIRNRTLVRAEDLDRYVESCLII